MFIFFLLLLYFINWPPLKFWDKSSPSLASFLSCIVANIALTCSKNTDSYSANFIEFDKIKTGKIVLALAIAESNVLLTILLSKVFKKKMGSYDIKVFLMLNTLIFLFVFVLYEHGSIT